MINPGDNVPPMQFKATNGLTTTCEHYRGSWLILYFYPKDATPGCTTEGCDFRDNEKAFSLMNATIFGISRDSLASHEKFKTKQDFSFELISDPDETLCQAFDVIRMKSMYGKQVRGIERSTFLIDPQGIVRHTWRKVRVKDHVTDVLQVLRSLQP
jgi:peroxiredoxin Q/BCP|tara:strand:+ start:60001 stop:60468 length:468 start_codon:yes stop_codon:yes gene_type:complete